MDTQIDRRIRSSSNGSTITTPRDSNDDSNGNSNNVEPCVVVWLVYARFEMASRANIHKRKRTDGKRRKEIYIYREKQRDR